MPTGYTAKLYDGKPQMFDEFVLDCARAFGALVLMRDDPTAEIPAEFQSDTRYYDENLEEARLKLVELSAMTPAQAEDAAAAEYEEALSGHREAMARRAAMRERYEGMLEQVRAWEPPTADHLELKHFMVKQLQESIKHDTEGYEQFAPTRVYGQAWVEKGRERATRDLDYYSGEREKEIERARSRTAWVSALRGSLEVSHA